MTTPRKKKRGSVWLIEVKAGDGRWDWQLSLISNKPHATKQNAVDELLRIQSAYTANKYRAKEYVRR